MPRKPDVVRIETSAGVLDAIERFEIRHAIGEPSSATVTLGDDGAWSELGPKFAPGTDWKLFVDGAAQITGRVEIEELNGSPDEGVTIVATIRSKQTDAYVAAADPGVKVVGTTILDFIVALFEPLGFSKNDFVFTTYAVRDLLSGKRGNTDKNPPADLEPIQVPQAKVQPGETIIEAALRHLERHGLIMWDSPDGKIVIGAPDNESPISYRFQLKKGEASKANNLLGFKRLRDFSEAPSEVWVYGQTWGGDLAKSTVYGVAPNLPMLQIAAETGHFKRKRVMVMNQIRTQEQARSKAMRELSAARFKQDAWSLRCDGLSYWDGAQQTKWALAAMSEVENDLMGGPQGSYMIVGYRLSGDENTGTSSTIDIVAKDTIKLR